MHHTHHHRRHILAAAVLLLPLPARATTYNLTNQTVNLATATYTAADTLNCSGVTFTSSISNTTLPATLTLVSGTTFFNNTANITLTGPITGSAALEKTGTGSLTLTAPSPSFLGPVTIDPGSPIRLTDPAALGPASANIPITLSGTLDATGSLPSRPFYMSAAGVLANNSSTPFTLGPSISLALSPNSSFLGLGGTGDLTFAASLPPLSNGSLSKTGTDTLTYSTATQFRWGVSVSAGTLRLGIESPFTNSNSFGPVSVSTGAILDLNGFNTTGIGISLGGGTLVNNNTTTSHLPSFPGGTAIFGGSGNINLTGKAFPFTKNDTGILILSAANLSFAGTLTLNDGTVQLNNASAVGNSSSSAFKLNGTSTTGGTFDLNGYLAPAGTYAFNGGALFNNNTSTPSTVGPTALLTGTPFFGGAGDILLTAPVPSTFYKFGTGTGTLTLSPATNSSATANIYAGILRIGNANALQSSAVNLYGSSPQFAYRATSLDFNGFAPPGGLTVNLSNNAGLINNNTSTPVTLSSITIAFPFSPSPASSITLGGDGTLNLTYAPFDNKTIDKIGAGLLTLPTSFHPAALNLRAGTLQAESNSQLGSQVSFLGGTLLIAPLYLPPQSSYTFTPSISVDPSTGGTLNTQRNSLFTGLLTGSGPFTKTGSANATLNLSPSSRLSLTLAAGILHLSSPSTPTLTSLSLTNGSLNVASAGLILDYTAFSPLPALLPFLASHQFYSSTADADPNHLTTLAYLDTGSSLNFSLAFPGDANLDGHINADDYALLDRGYAKHLTTWQNGDFNYDGIIDQSDYLLLDRSYLLTTSTDPASLLARRESQFGQAYVTELLTTLPEPALSFACLFLLPRRRV